MLETKVDQLKNSQNEDILVMVEEIEAVKKRLNLLEKKLKGKIFA